MGIYCRQDVHQLAVRVGNHHLYLEDPDQADIGVHKIILHENYDSWNMQNDICLLELESVADFSSPVHRRSCLSGRGGMCPPSRKETTVLQEKNVRLLVSRHQNYCTQ